MLDASGLLELIRIMLDPDRWNRLQRRHIKIGLPNGLKQIWVTVYPGDGFWGGYKTVEGSIESAMPTYEVLSLGVRINDKMTVWIPLRALISSQVEINIADLTPAVTATTSNPTP